MTSGDFKPGAKADITVFDLSAPHLGQVIDPIQTMMLVGQGRDVRTVVIDGRFVMVDRVIEGIDEVADNAGRRLSLRTMSLYPMRTCGHPPVAEIFSSSYPLMVETESPLP